MAFLLGRRDELAHLHGDCFVRTKRTPVVVSNNGDDSHAGLQEGKRLVQFATWPVFTQFGVAVQTGTLRVTGLNGGSMTISVEASGRVTIP